MMSFYELAQVSALRRLAKDYNLERKWLLDHYNLPALQRICNGVGPARWPEILRKIVNVKFASLEPAAAIHDVEYYRGGNYFDFTACNMRFYFNCRTIARMKYPAARWARWALAFRGMRLAAYCQIWGYSAWKERTRKQKGKGV